MPYELEVMARPADIDELGHVSNVVYLRWVQEVAIAHSSARGWDGAAYQRLGASWVVRRHEIDYVLPVFEGERLTLATWVESIKGASSVRRTRMTRVADGAVVCRATTTWAFIDLARGRLVRIPDDLRAAFPTESVGGSGAGG
ncbi:MAG TPA: acyl-CoA thioesterase [Kofleriaceae bacterium]|nr:acyl-CoA thioesterase [Kofleriaceae bacterium]